MSAITILSKTEEKSLYSLKELNFKEKVYFFQIPTILLEKVLSFELEDGKVAFLLMYGYFKAFHQFYDVSEYNQSDLDYICEKYELPIIHKIDITKRRYQQYKVIIKSHLQVNEYTDEIKATLQKEAINLANNFIHRKRIFYTLVNLSKKLNIEIPSYTELTRIIQVALNTQKKDILEKLESLREDERLKILDEFLEKDKDSKNRYIIAYFRRLEHSTAKNQMLLSLGKLHTIQSKFNILKEIIDNVGITPKIAQYYAKWVEKGKTFQINQTNTLNQKFTLLAFVHYQYLIGYKDIFSFFRQPALKLA